MLQLIKQITNKLLYIIIITALMWSCIPQKRLILMQYDDMNDSTYALTFTGTEYADSVYRIQVNDYLYIDITSVEREITNIFTPNTAINYITGGNQALTGYYVNGDGTIDFPYIGQIYLRGLTIREAMETVKIASESLVEKARVEVRLINNTISVLGEVYKPDSYTITKSKITIFDAITLAKGFTSYAKRNKVKVLRVVDGADKIFLVDLNSGKLQGKKMFYVYANDIVYVEPMRAKSIGLTPTFSLTVLTTVITFVVLITSLNN
jgi:polysaccharide export outer membrane protein